MTDSDTAYDERVERQPRCSTGACPGARCKSPRAVAGGARGRRRADARADLADRARRHRAHDRIRADRAGRPCHLSRLSGCRTKASSCTMSAPLAIALLAMLAFQIADIYQVQAFRGHEKQYMRLASAWSVVFLLVIGASFFAKAGEKFSRVWLGGFYVIGLVALLVSRKLLVLRGAPMDARGPAHAPHRDRRRRRSRRAVIEAIKRRRIRRPDHRHVRRSRRRALAAPNAPASPSSAPSTIWSSSPAAPASIW